MKYGLPSFNISFMVCTYSMGDILLFKFETKLMAERC